MATNARGERENEKHLSRRGKGVASQKVLYPPSALERKRLLEKKKDQKREEKYTVQGVIYRRRGEGTGEGKGGRKEGRGEGGGKRGMDREGGEGGKDGKRGKGGYSRGMKGRGSGRGERGGWRMGRDRKKGRMRRGCLGGQNQGL